MPNNKGRVEVCVNMNWETECDDWNALDAPFFGQGTDPIVLDDVRCVGTESRLIDCPFTATHNCIHLEDARVRCKHAH